MKHIKHLAFISLALTAVATPAIAFDEIIHPYQSIRTEGMGGVFLTTGLYDQNFYGNPARVLANPKWKITLVELTSEANGTSAGHVNDFMNTSGNAIYSKVGDTAGSNNHFRAEANLASIYIPAGDGKWAFAVGILSSTQANFALDRNFQIEPGFVTDTGPAFTVGRKFLGDALGVGVTAHATYRLATSQGFTFVDLIKGNQLSGQNIGGQGVNFDGDVGATYALPLEILGAKWTAGAAINNVLGGNYSNSTFHPITSITTAPPSQPRSLGFGGSASWETLSVFRDVTAALEFSDIGNNANGSLFRTVHLGGEGRWGLLLPRLGLNQGYVAAGLGIDMKVLTLDFATYGEEMSLNAGGLEDRRYAFRIALQI